MPLGWEPRARDFPAPQPADLRAVARRRDRRGGAPLRLADHRAACRRTGPRGVRRARLAARSARGRHQRPAQAGRDAGHRSRRRDRGAASRSSAAASNCRRRGARADARRPSAEPGDDERARIVGLLGPDPGARSTIWCGCRKARRRSCARCCWNSRSPAGWSVTAAAWSRCYKSAASNRDRTNAPPRPRAVLSCWFCSAPARRRRAVLRRLRRRNCGRTRRPRASRAPPSTSRCAASRPTRASSPPPSGSRNTASRSATTSMRMVSADRIARGQQKVKQWSADCSTQSSSDFAVERWVLTRALGHRKRLRRREGQMGRVPLAGDARLCRATAIPISATS